MARPEKRLTARAVETIKKPGLHADGAGLYLHVSRNGARSWIFRWRRDGRLRDMGLGPLNTVSLAEARDKALACRKLKYDGRDPIEERRAQRRRQARNREGDDVQGMRRGIHRRAPRRLEERQARRAVAGDARDLRLPDHRRRCRCRRSTRRSCMKVLEPIWSEKPETRRAGVRGRIESVLDWATARGYRAGREPGALARPSRQPAAEAIEGAARRASCGAALCRDRRLHGRAARARGRRRARARIRDPDRGAHRRSDRRHMGARSTLESRCGRSRPSG